MAYNSAQRFPPPPKYYKIFDPGAYQYTNPPLLHQNKAPFLSKCPRNTFSSRKLWTQAIYDIDLRPKIPNCTSLRSPIPRFPYEALSDEDIKDILCRCGIEDPCECPVEEADNDKENIVCQAKVRRHIYIGPMPRPFSDGGISAPSHNDRGFKLLEDGSQKRILKEKVADCPPFYNVNIVESSAFYRGCKWSKWTSSRSQKSPEVRPGPADYTLEMEPNYNSCAEKIRFQKRKTSKQLRFIEMVQRQNILEGRPGPATYSPIIPKGPELQYIGPRANRFSVSKYNVGPGPADHWIKRDFDSPEIPEKWCHANLPTPAPFGVNDVRLKPQKEEGPSPASYDAVLKTPNIVRCSVPFGSSTKRFKETNVEEDDESIEEDSQNSEEKTQECGPTPQWQFKSKTIRMKPLVKNYNDPSPADFPQPQLNVNRSPRMQYTSPFFSSEGRFRPWYNAIPVHGKERTPGPAYYCLEKYKCQPAVFRGPLYRSRRFASNVFKTPAPNEYKVGGGIETILSTHNQKLKHNIDSQHQFIWVPPPEPIKLTLEEQESKLLDQSIALLDTTDVFECKPTKDGMSKSSIRHKDTNRSKLLRCFVYTKQIPPCF